MGTLLGEWNQRVPAQEINAGIVLGAHSEPETSPWPLKVAFDENSRHRIFAR